MKTNFLWIITCIAVLFYPVFSIAFDASSASFYVRQSIQSISGESSSASFKNLAAGGQTSTGQSSSATFIDLSGILHLLHRLYKPQFEQVRYHWRNDDGSESAATSATGGTEDTTLTNLSKNTTKRVRIEIANTGASGVAGGAPASQTYRLEYGLKSTTCAAIGTWTDVGAVGGDWDMSDSINLTDGSNTTNIAVSTGGVTDRLPTFETPNAAVKDTSSQTAGIALSSTEFVEIEYSIRALDAAQSSGTYCFRVTNAGSTTNFLYVEARYAQATIAAGAIFTPKSQNWRWYDDETNETPITALAAENIAPANVVNQNIIKLRLTINETAGVAGVDIKFKIQFSEYSDFSQGVNNAVEIGSCTGNSLWCYGDGVDADNAAITTRVLTDSTANGTHNESGTSASTFDPAASTATEFEFTLKHAGARANATYFFRAFDVTNNQAVPLNTGETFASLSTEGATLTFTVGGLSSGTATEGVTTDVTTTSTGVPFGTLSFGTETEGAQRLTVSTNATEGYQIFVFQRQVFLHTAYGGVDIDPVTGTNASPSAWATGCASAAAGCYGYHAGDDALAGGSARFSPNDTYAQFTTTSQEIAFSSIPVTNEATDIIFKTKITNQQEAGNYSSTIVYIVVPTF